MKCLAPPPLSNYLLSNSSPARCRAAPNHLTKEMIEMPETKLSTRAQNILDLLEEVLLDLTIELRKEYSEVDIKLSISAD